jgi:hypothetical protein
MGMHGKVTRGGKAKRREMWVTEPGRAEERREAAAEPAKQPPGKKDTRQWCKGKPGREHQRGNLVLKRWGHGDRGCGWRPYWAHDKGDWDNGEYKVQWECWHRDTCGECGKVLRDQVPARECPDYPGTGEQKAAAEREAREWAERRAEHRRRWGRKKPVTGPSHYRKKR